MWCIQKEIEKKKKFPLFLISILSCTPGLYSRNYILKNIQINIKRMLKSTSKDPCSLAMRRREFRTRDPVKDCSLLKFLWTAHFQSIISEHPWRIHWFQWIFIKFLSHWGKWNFKSVILQSSSSQSQNNHLNSIYHSPKLFICIHFYFSLPNE